jgi:hypothetical protein
MILEGPRISPTSPHFQGIETNVDCRMKYGTKGLSRSAIDDRMKNVSLLFAVGWMNLAAPHFLLILKV